MRKLTLILIFSLLLFSCSTTEKTFDVTIPTPNIETDVQEGDEGTPMESFTPIVRSVDSTISNFNYAYAVRLTDEIKATGYSISGPYFALGMYDASEKTSSSRFYSLIEIKDILYSYSGDGVFSISGKRPNTVEEILKLSAPEDEIEAFSYALSFNIVRDNISAGIEIDILSLLEGVLDTLYSDSSPLTIDEIQNAVNLYIEYLNKEYYREMEETELSNRENATLFFERNGKEEGVTTLENGVQILLLDSDEITGNSPTQYDRVLMDYNEYVLSYKTGELEYTDADYGVEIHIIDLNNGLQSAITSMHTGEAIRAFIPPELSGREEGTEDIPPYSVYVYDIALHKIL